jgi:hypothetical protein
MIYDAASSPSKTEKKYEACSGPEHDRNRDHTNIHTCMHAYTHTYTIHVWAGELGSFDMIYDAASSPTQGEKKYEAEVMPLLKPDGK